MDPRQWWKASATGHAMRRRLHLRYGRAARDATWRPGDVARTTAKIPADPHAIFPPVVVMIEEVLKMKHKRRKDRFGNWDSFGGGTRVRVGYNGKSYWVDAETLEHT